PGAAGMPISMVHSEHTVIWAFIEAGIYAVVAIAVMLWIAPRRRRAVDAGTADRCRRSDPRTDRADRRAAQLRQCDRLAPVARCRRGVQDLLHHGMAARRHQPAAVDPHPRRAFQRADDGNSIWEPVAIEPAGPVQHG